MLGVDIGDPGVDVRPDPERVLAVLAVHRLQPGAIGQPEFALLLVGMRRFRARNPDGVDGQAVGHLFGPVAGGLADQVDELALRPDRIADAHQALVAQGVDRVEDEILDSRGFLDHGQQDACACCPDDRSTLVVLNPRACQPGVISITAGLALMPLESLPPNGSTAPSRQRRISLKVTLPSTICDGPVMMQSEFGLVSSHQRMIPATQ